MKQSKEGILLNIRAHPGSSKKKVETSSQRIDIYMNSPAEKGKANKEAMSVLAKALAIPVSSIEIVRGEKSRNKTVLIKGLDLENAKSRLESPDNE